VPRPGPDVAQGAKRQRAGEGIEVALKILVNAGHEIQAH
jgi:hypothetical protein